LGNPPWSSLKKVGINGKKVNNLKRIMLKGPSLTSEGLIPQEKSQKKKGIYQPSQLPWKLTFPNPNSKFGINKEGLKKNNSKGVPPNGPPSGTKKAKICL